MKKKKFLYSIWAIFNNKQEEQLEILKKKVNKITEGPYFPIHMTISSMILGSERELIKNSVLECDEERIIIIHGTDTMDKTAKFLEDIKEKTIILTGAMQPARFKKTDAIFNSGFAYAAALSLDHGIYIAMNGEIFNPNNVKKNIDLGRFETKE